MNSFVTSLPIGQIANLSMLAAYGTLNYGDAPTDSQFRTLNRYYDAVTATNSDAAILLLPYDTVGNTISVGRTANTFGIFWNAQYVDFDSYLRKK